MTPGRPPPAPQGPRSGTAEPARGGRCGAAGRAAAGPALLPGPGPARTPTRPRRGSGGLPRAGPADPLALQPSPGGGSPPAPDRQRLCPGGGDRSRARRGPGGRRPNSPPPGGEGARRPRSRPAARPPGEGRSARRRPAAAKSFGRSFAAALAPSLSLPRRREGRIRPLRPAGRPGHRGGTVAGPGEEAGGARGRGSPAGTGGLRGPRGSARKPGAAGTLGRVPEVFTRPLRGGICGSRKASWSVGQATGCGRLRRGNPRAAARTRLPKRPASLVCDLMRSRVREGVLAFYFTSSANARFGFAIAPFPRKSTRSPSTGRCPDRPAGPGWHSPSSERLPTSPTTTWPCPEHKSTPATPKNWCSSFPSRD